MAKRIKKEKPKILIMPNRPNWILDFMADNLIKRLSLYYDFEKKCCQDCKLKKEDTQDYDLVHIIYPGCIKSFDPKSSTFVTGIHSYTCWYEKGKCKTPSRKFIKKLREFQCIHTVCKNLYNLFKNIHPHVFYVSLGIDTKFFKPKAKKKHNRELVLGFVGNPKHYGADKGYYQIIEPAFKKIKGAKLITALRGKDQIPQKKMPAFYNKLDALLCLSRSEGIPIPPLEAMACGIPCITTNVGAIPEVIKDGINGRIIKRSKKALIKAIEELKNNRELYRNMGREARRTVVKKWTWEKKIKDWKKFYDYSLGLRK